MIKKKRVATRKSGRKAKVWYVTVLFANGGTRYTYQSLDKHKRGDMVVVDSRTGAGFAMVVDVKDSSNFNGHHSWVLGKFDVDAARARISKANIKDGDV